PVPEGSPYRVLGRAGIRRLTESGLVDLGAHSESHAILARLAPAAQEREIGRSLDAVREITGAPCRWFEDPNGSASEYARHCVDYLASRGVRAALTSVWGACDAGTSLLEVPRCGVSARESAAWLRFRLRQLRPRGPS